VKGDRKPFQVVAIFHDDRFTYIKANARELPALYEITDGTSNLINFQVEHGVYVVPKILERGALVIGTKTLTFERAQ
jgi:type IV secretion system protein VirB9